MESSIHQDFRYQHMLKVPPKHLWYSLLEENDDGQTCLHIAATCDSLGFIPNELLTAENLLKVDRYGDTPIHLAAFTGRLYCLPLCEMELTTFETKDGDGKSVIDVAREKGHLDQIPQHILMSFPSYRREAISHFLRSIQVEKIPSALSDPRDWEEEPDSHPYYGSFYHEAAEIGVLDRLPNTIFLPHSLSLKDKRKKTPLHILAESGTPGSLARILAKMNFRLQSLEPDAQGNTIFHCAAIGGQIASLPEEALTLETVTKENHKGLSVLDLAFRSHCLDAIPLELRFLSDDYARERLREALVSGDCGNLEPSLFSISSLERLMPITSGKDSALYLAAGHGTLHLVPPDAFTDEALEVFDRIGFTPFHLAAEAGKLAQVPERLLTEESMSRPDKNGRTLCHIAIATGHLGDLPTQILSNSILLIPDRDGMTSFHLGADQKDFGGIPVTLFTRGALLTKDKADQSVADLIESNGNTPLLPPHLRNFSKTRALLRLEECLSSDFVSAADFHSRELADLIPLERFQSMKRDFVQEWAGPDPDWSLDEEQADAVAESGRHIQVTARAGSGKTRTLVARAIFQIKHCRIAASSILILAFNKKSVEEIRERLGKRLTDNEMPHVLTFHALAYRIVRPEEDLVFDGGETKEGQVFSTTIQRIIDEEMRGGASEAKLRELMDARWRADLGQIIELGFNLPQEEFLAHRANLLRSTMNGRRVDTEAHKHIGNALLRLGIRYSYRRGIHRAAGTAYAPDFSHYHKETDQRFLIEILGEDASQANAARQAFWNSDRSANAHLVQFTIEDCQDPDATLEHVTKELATRGLAVSAMSDDELWLALRDDIIRDFTKAVRGFISRCQKELISPDRLDQMLPDSDPELWRLRKIGDNRYIREPTIDGMQVRFWRLCSGIYRRYRQVLAESHQTDFDQLMLDAAGMIHEGNTGFSSARGRGDICEIRHLLIDEYQDFSHLFDELRKSIIVQSPDPNFFCVGDDWQAINKFAGSDLQYFTGFTEIFEPSVRKLITRNYRSCRKIVEIGNRVMQGEGEPSVPNSNEQGNTWRVEVGDYGNLSEAEEIVVEELGDDALAILRIASDCTSRRESVAILSRTSSVATPEGMHKLEKWKERLRSFLPEKVRVLLEVSTTHGYKGKEADVVILLDPEAYPFVHPDAIFNTIFGDTFQSIQDDEKRLFYVGVTRPKKTLYLLSYPSRYSEERPYKIRFLDGAYPQDFDINRLKSKLLCGGRIIVRLTNRPGIYGSGGTFPIKDQLKKSEFKWNEERKIWSIFLERGSISSPFECIQYINAQPWIANADGIVASFAWEDQIHHFRISNGTIAPESPLSDGKEDSSRPGARRVQDQEAASQASEIQEAGKRNQYSPASYDSSALSSKTFETNIAGMKYSGHMQKASGLSVGDPLQLVREPLNKHDANAIMVMTQEGVQIGYLSKHVAAHLYKALDALGGKLEAKVSSVWTQPAPNFMVSIEVKFPLPNGVKIPAWLSATAGIEDSPFAPSRPRAKAAGIGNVSPNKQAGADRKNLSDGISPTVHHSNSSPNKHLPKSESGKKAEPKDAAQPSVPSPHLQRIEIHHTQVDGVSDETRAPAIRSLRVGEVVLLKRQPDNPSDQNAIQVLKTDTRSLGYIPSILAARVAHRFDEVGGCLPATVTEMSPGITKDSFPSLSIEFEIPPVAPAQSPAPASTASIPVVPQPEPAPSPSLLEDLSPKLRNELTDFCDEQFHSLIADLYLSGASGWPSFGYEAIGADGRCTGSMLEVAWPDNKIGISIPTNDAGSFEASGWEIFPATTASAIELRNLFTAETEKTQPPGTDQASDSTSTETDIRFKHGPFHDDAPDDDIPF